MCNLYMYFYINEERFCLHKENKRRENKKKKKKKKVGLSKAWFNRSISMYPYFDQMQ